jgi:hypothetical protein
MFIAVEILNRSTISDESRLVTKRLVGPIQDPIMKHRIGFYHSSKLLFFCSMVFNRVKPKQCGNPLMLLLMNWCLCLLCTGGT